MLQLMNRAFMSGLPEMAGSHARIRTAVGKGTMPQAWRDRIQASMIVNRLTDHIKGDVELSPTQVTAATVLLRKSIPDLAAVVISGDQENPLRTIQEVVQHSVRPKS